MKKIYICGHRGMVGSSIMRALQARGDCELVTRTHRELDLCNQAEVNAFFASEKPDAVIHCAAKVGGIHANRSYPAEFIYQNLAMATHVIHAAWQHGVQRLVYLGSSCIYPREAPQPMQEDCLLTGPLESTNEAYALAKISGLKMCQYYRSQYGVCFHSAMPTNLYGPGDNYHPDNSHVIPGLIRRFHQAKVDQDPSVILWGTGTPKREFLHVDDLASGVLHVLDLENPPDIVNIGYGDDISIRDLADLVKSAVGYEGRIELDPSMPDGTPRKLMDNSRIRELGWKPTISLEEGLARTVKEFLAGDHERTV
ncbi:GDP-L-fucose synthase [Kiritimatiellaeota bacterium B1221]|nr:GDP-L-fucose synthase [Kiritimatiellaeota bacterium B1221]